MPERIHPASSARVMFKAYLASDHLSVATGKTIALKISKAGGAFADPSVGATNLTELSNGWYYFDPLAADYDTFGAFIYRATVATVDDIEKEYTVGLKDGSIAGGAAQSASSTGVRLKTTESATDNYYNGCTIVIRSALAGGGQSRTIIGYTGATKDVLVEAWTTTPTSDATHAIVYDIYGTPPATAAQQNAEADALLDRTDAIEPGVTPRGALRLAAAGAAGKRSGFSGTAPALAGANNPTKNRILAAGADADGNTSSVTVDTTT